MSTPLPRPGLKFYWRTQLGNPRAKAKTVLSFDPRWVYQDGVQSPGGRVRYTASKDLKGQPSICCGNYFAGNAVEIPEPTPEGVCIVDVSRAPFLREMVEKVERADNDD